MQIMQIDLYTIEKNWFITAIDCFSKFGVIKPIKSRSRVDIETSLFEILTQISIPEIVVMDNEPSLKSEVIRSKMREINVKAYETPTGRSEVNGQIEKFHSTITEIYRCLKTEDIAVSPSNRIKLAVDRYNNSVHSVNKMTPREALFGQKMLSDATAQKINEQREKDTHKIIKKLTINQILKRKFQIKNKKNPIDYKEGELVLAKNKQIISKHVNPKKFTTVNKNNNVTVVDSRGSKLHKIDLKQVKQ